jgi:hypothetical protein
MATARALRLLTTATETGDWNGVIWNRDGVITGFLLLFHSWQKLSDCDIVRGSHDNLGAPGLEYQ